MFSTKFCNDGLKFIMNARNMKKNPTSIYLRSWNLRPKPYLAIIVWAILLMINFKDLILIFYIVVLSIAMKGNMKNPI